MDHGSRKPLGDGSRPKRRPAPGTDSFTNGQIYAQSWRPSSRYSRQRFWPMATHFPPLETSLACSNCERNRRSVPSIVVSRFLGMNRRRQSGACATWLGGDGLEERLRIGVRKITVEQGSLPRFHRDRDATWLVWRHAARILAGFYCIKWRGGLLLSQRMDLLGERRNSRMTVLR